MMIFQDHEKFFIITEYCDPGELVHYFKRDFRYCEKRVKFYLAELIEAIESLHERDFIYRDLKPRNLLLNNEGHLILSDFGLAK